MFNNLDPKQIEGSISQVISEYKIQPGDEISIRAYTRQGASLIEGIKNNTTAPQDATSQNISIIYVVDPSGYVNLPLVGKILANGMTESELKNKAEKILSNQYQEPFVQVRVENRRVVVYKGIQAAVVNLNKSPTSLFEVIARTGGLERHMSTADILIIRGNNLNKPIIYKVNLQTIDGIKKSETTLQPNDIVYIPERKRKLFHAMNDIAPVVSVPLTILSSLVTSALLIVTLKK